MPALPGELDAALSWAHLRFFFLAFRNRNRNRRQRLFDHEKLEVYQAFLSFVAWFEPVLQKLAKSLALADQLDPASTSIPLNQGNGEFTGADRCRFFDIGRVSALESAAALDVLVAKGRCSVEEILTGKDRGIVSMLVALIKANSDYRLPDASPE